MKEAQIPYLLRSNPIQEEEDNHGDCLITPAEEKTWTTVSPILSQTLLRMKISSFEPEEISHILPLPFNGIDRQCPEYALVNGESFTINRMLTRWALDHDNITPTTVILLPPPPNQGNVAHAAIGDFRVYGDGHGRLYVIRMVEGRALIGATDTLITYGTAAADEIAQISSGYAIYKPSDKDLFHDVSNYNKSNFFGRHSHWKRGQSPHSPKRCRIRYNFFHSRPSALG